VRADLVIGRFGCQILSVRVARVLARGAVGIRGTQLRSEAASLALIGGGLVQGQDLSNNQDPRWLGWLLSAPTAPRTRPYVGGRRQAAEAVLNAL